MRLIDAHRVLDEIDRLITKEVEQNCVNSAYYALKFVRALIDGEPEIDLERLRPCGEWIHKEGEENEWYCSICGSDFSFADIDFTPYNSGLRYCPDCGAKMDKGDSQ